MGLADLPRITHEMNNKDLSNALAKIVKELQSVINGRIDARNIRAESIEAQNIKAGAITAEKIDVEELSAISANLGHIVAGLIESVTIIGSYIATANGTFPRAEMSNTKNLFGAYNAEGYGVEMGPASIDDKTALILKDNDYEMGELYATNTDFYIQANLAMRIQAGLNVRMISTGIRGFIYDNFYKIYNLEDEISLGSVLEDFENRISALEGS